MANKKVTPNSLTDAYKKRKGDFSPDLVGLQITNGTALFTLGNFGVTTNAEPKTDRTFNTGVFSDVFTLENLNLTEQQSEALVSNNIYTTLNVDPQDLSKFVYYGSFVEYLRVNIEGILLKWKGSLYITDDLGPYTPSAKNTVLGYTYNSLTEESTLTIPTLFVENKYDLIYNDLGGVILDGNDISNIKLSYDSYVLSTSAGDFDLLGYTGSTNGTNPYIKVIVDGEPFPSLTGSTFGTFQYHIKPKDELVDRLFFDTLTDFEDILLNRMTIPKYTSSFEAPVETEAGVILLSRKTFTWPTTDGFNLDLDTIEYSDYIDKIFKLAVDYDRLKSNIITRRFVSNSIQEFDTDDGTETETQGRKINKLLKIYGREFDEIKKYTDSIKFANVVTYNKRDNTPDELIKTIAKTMGFETIKSVTDNELISYIAKSNQSVFSGQSRDMSTKEIDTELWRRLVINAWWLYKSKGHRKVIEFFIKLFGLGECLVNFDECVYVVDNKLDVEELFLNIENVLGRTHDPADGPLEIDRTDYPIDEQGFPRVMPNTPDIFDDEGNLITKEYYFQMNGYWYTNETDKTVGNNPHYGPYDYGSEYFNRFNCFIDDFSGQTTVTQQTYSGVTNLFPDYNKGDLEITFEDGKPLRDYGTTYADVMTDTNRVTDMTRMIGAGFTTENSRTGRGSIKMTFACGEPNCDIIPCESFTLDKETGLVLSFDDDTPYPEECCELQEELQYINSRPSSLIEPTTEEGKEIENLYEERFKKKYGDTFLKEPKNSKLCYWCPQVDTICDYGSYISTTLIKSGDVDGYINILISEGIVTEGERKKLQKQWGQFKSYKEITQKYEDQISKKYDGLCVLIHEEAGDVSEECCKTRGGKWTDISKKKKKDKRGKDLTSKQLELIKKGDSSYQGKTGRKLTKKQLELLSGLESANAIIAEASDWMCVIPKADPCDDTETLVEIILDPDDRGCDISFECCDGDDSLYWIDGDIKIIDNRDVDPEFSTTRWVDAGCNGSTNTNPCDYLKLDGLEKIGRTCVHFTNNYPTNSETDWIVNRCNTDTDVPGQEIVFEDYGGLTVGPQPISDITCCHKAANLLGETNMHPIRILTDNNGVGHCWKLPYLLR